ncbi:MAG: hypothetical protein JNG84_10905 [Archangium sp.]|nr:hypothetical protein [Archangium sp.]
MRAARLTGVGAGDEFVELRVTHRWLTKTPTGYALSLWVMGAAGPDDVDLGHFESMFDATRVSAQLDEFVARANTKQAGRTHLS